MVHTDCMPTAAGLSAFGSVPCAADIVHDTGLGTQQEDAHLAVHSQDADDTQVV